MSRKSIIEDLKQIGYKEEDLISYKTEELNQMLDESIAKNSEKNSFDSISTLKDATSGNVSELVLDNELILKGEPEEVKTISRITTTQNYGNADKLQNLIVDTTNVYHGEVFVGTDGKVIKKKDIKVDVTQEEYVNMVVIKYVAPFSYCGKQYEFNAGKTYKVPLSLKLHLQKSGRVI